MAHVGSGMWFRLVPPGGRQSPWMVERMYRQVVCNLLDIRLFDLVAPGNRLWSTIEYSGAHRFGDGRSRPAEPPHSNVCGGLRVCFFVFEELSELFWETVGRPLLKDLESRFGEANGAQS